MPVIKTGYGWGLWGLGEGTGSSAPTAPQAPVGTYGFMDGLKVWTSPSQILPAFGNLGTMWAGAPMAAIGFLVPVVAVGVILLGGAAGGGYVAGRRRGRRGNPGRRRRRVRTTGRIRNSRPLRRGAVYVVYPSTVGYSTLREANKAAREDSLPQGYARVERSDTNATVAEWRWGKRSK